MGWSPDQFWDATPFEFWNALEGFVKFHTNIQQNEWNRTRVLAFYSFLPHAKRGSLNRPIDLFPLEWDEERTDKPIMTPDQLVGRAEELANFTPLSELDSLAIIPMENAD